MPLPPFQMRREMLPVPPDNRLNVLKLMQTKTTASHLPSLHRGHRVLAPKGGFSQQFKLTRLPQPYRFSQYRAIGFFASKVINSNHYRGRGYLISTVWPLTTVLVQTDTKFKIPPVYRGQWF
jgi:hypothetical protein